MSSKVFAVSVSLLLVICAIPASSMMENENLSDISELDDQHVKLIISLHGSDDAGEYKVTVSREKFEKLKEIFNETLEKLERTNSDEEAREILNDTVIRLGKIGILPKHVSIESIQKLVAMHFVRNAVKRKVQNIVEKNLGNLRNITKGVFSKVDNVMCLICGYADRAAVTGIFMYGPISILLVTLPLFLSVLSMNVMDELVTSIIEKIMNRDISIYVLDEIILLVFCLFLSIISALPPVACMLKFCLPISLLGFIRLGNEVTCWEMPGSIINPSSGRIWTKGLNGVKVWDGEFYGKLCDPVEWYSLFHAFCVWRGLIGACGFAGLKINAISLKEDEIVFSSYFLGSALAVGINYVNRSTVDTV